MAKWNAQGALGKGLQRLWQRIDSVKASARRSICIGVLNFGDYLTSDSAGMWQLGPMRTGEGIIFSILKAEAPTGDPHAFLLDVLNECKGVSLPAHVVALVTNLTQTPELENFFKEDAVKQGLRAWLVARIYKRSLSKDLFDLGDLKLVLKLWIEWGDKAAERSRVIELCREVPDAAKFVKAMLQISHSSNVDKHGSSRRARIKPSDLEEYGSWDQVKVVLLDRRLPEEIEVEFAEALKALRKASKRKDAGKPETDSPFDDDDL